MHRHMITHETLAHSIPYNHKVIRLLIHSLTIHTLTHTHIQTHTSNDAAVEAQPPVEVQAKLCPVMENS